MFAIVAAGFMLGLLGSAHCIGMCGPLALSLPWSATSRISRFTELVIYQVGRVLSYATIGLILGIAGRHLRIAGLQQILSVTVGILVLLSLIFYFGQNRSLQLPVLSKFYRGLQQFIVRLLQKPKTFYTYFLLGIANGFLPCGMVYISLAGALSSGSLPASVLFMVSFGAGTIPAMMLVSFFGLLIKPDIRIHMQKMIPITIALMGVLLVLRGLNLGIPYISPLLPGERAETIPCH